MKVLITGAEGALGSEIRNYFPNAIAPTHSELDVTNHSTVVKVFAQYQPDLVIHSAAIADVRRCEETKDLAWTVNVIGTQNVVDCCSKSANNPFLLYPSTPCVFKGDEGSYSENSTLNPQNYYGRTKEAAEKIVLEYENSLVFRKNFVPRKKWKYPKAFEDRFGTYMFADEVANVVSQLSSSSLRGIVHIAGSERISMFDLAKITTPDIKPMSMRDIDLQLSVDMSLTSERIGSFPIVKSPERPSDYSDFVVRTR